jgi:hypothetical protein
MKNLVADTGAKIEVVKPGNYNTGAGPDFFNAQLRVDGTLWAGNVEIHINSSDWRRHQHHSDPAYENCILHVVHTNDAPTISSNGTTIPVIQIKDRYPSHLWENYLKLIGTTGWVACQPRIHEVEEFTWKSTIDKMILERIEIKTEQILIALKGNKDDWEECFYQHLARNFGFNLNALPFEMLARSLPLKYILKERTSQLNIDAMIFGQSGMLQENDEDVYPSQLRDAYTYFSKKYSLKSIPVSSWKFLRLRPVNFPTIRLAQFAVLLSRNPSLFRFIIDCQDLVTMKNIFNVQANSFWNTHFVFGKVSAHSEKKLGGSSIENILINSCIPFIAAWGKFIGDEKFKNRAIEFLALINCEENHLISKWRELGVKTHTAVDTQALIQLYTRHCSEKKCLTCNIGNRLINTLQ